MKTKILISGAGPAGIATALLLDEQQFDITVIEQGPKIMDMGFSIILWKAGYDVLEQVVGPLTKPDIWPINRINIHGGDELKLLHNTDTLGLGHSIERHTLMNKLAMSLEAKFGHDFVKFNSTITAIDFNDITSTVTFDNGMSDEYDIIIAADGMHSSLRSKHFNVTMKTGPYKIIYQWILPGSQLKEESLVGFMKDAVYLVQTVGDKALLAHYTVGETEHGDKFTSALRESIARDYGGALRFEEGSKNEFSAEEVKVEKAYRNNLVLIGDALHGHPPTLAMGTSMAFEDAQALATELNSAPGLDALVRYEKIRKSRLKDVYSAQHVIEKSFITSSDAQLKLVQIFMKYGGSEYIEHWIKSLIK